MTIKSKKYGRDQDYDGNKIINSSLNVDSISFIFSDIDTDPGQVYILDLKARFGYIIEKVALKTDTGSMAVTILKNGTGINGLMEKNVTDETTDYTTSSESVSRIIAIDDVVTLEIISLTDTPLQLTGNIQIKRT